MNVPVPDFGRSGTEADDMAQELLKWQFAVGKPYAEAIVTLQQAIDTSADASDRVRRKLFLTMQRAWHPDKNADHPDATAVFQWLQEQKESYLGSAATPHGTPRGTPRG
jgi:hypothetical protein